MLWKDSIALWCSLSGQELALIGSKNFLWILVETFCGEVEEEGIKIIN